MRVLSGDSCFWGSILEAIVRSKTAMFLLMEIPTDKKSFVMTDSQLDTITLTLFVSTTNHAPCDCIGVQSHAVKEGHTDGGNNATPFSLFRLFC
jgi:hypothetical protein